MDCQCGFASAALNGDGNIRLCTETHPFALAGLLAGLVDHDRCEACAAELPTRPSVLVYFRDPPAIYAVAGMRLAEAGPDAFAERLKPLFAAAPAALPPEVLPDLDALRRRVAERLRTRLAVLDPLCEADTRNARHEYLPAHWREFTPAVFAAALVRLLGPLPGADLRLMVHKEPGSGPPTAADGVAALADVQAHVWLMLAQSWMGLRHAARLEDDLDGYIDPGVLVAGATDRLFGYFDRLQENKNLFVLTRYGLEAIRATLCAAEGRANPHSRRWSNLLFGHEVFCEIGGDQVEPKHRVMRLPAERLRGTVSFAEAWAEAADWLRFADQSGAKDRRGELVAALDVVAEKLGYPVLVGRVMERQEILTPNHLPLEDLLALQRETAATVTHGPVLERVGGFLIAQKSVARLLLRDDRLDDLDRLADAIPPLFGDTDEVRAEVEGWLGSLLKDVRQPGRFLARVGDEPRPWEHALPPETRVSLWVERSNALRMVGRAADARRAIEAAAAAQPADASPTDRCTLQMNLAILERETGEPDQALHRLLAILPQAGPTRRLGLLTSLAVTANLLGRHDEALTYHEQALALAVGPEAERRPDVEAGRLLTLVAVGRGDEALPGLIAFRVDPRRHPAALASVACAWVILLANRPSLPSDASEALWRVADALPGVVEASRASGDAAVRVGVLSLIAWLLEVVGRPEKARRGWLAAHRARQETGLPPDDVVLASLAYYAYLAGDIRAARAYLGQVPAALGSRVGGAGDLVAVIGAGGSLRARLDALAGPMMLPVPPWADLRLVAELKRDAIGRARRRASTAGDAPLLADGLGDAVLARLAPPTGCLAVLEWVDDRERIAAFVTGITAKTVRSGWLGQPGVDLASLRKRMEARLRNWLPSRPGDPFDLPEWKALEGWLGAALGEPATGSRLVVLEHADYAGLPWHAAAPGWPTSYTPGWSTLLALHASPPPAPTSLGLVMVPRFGESQEVLGTFRRSAERTQRFATDRGLSLDAALERGGDATAARRVLEGAGLAKLLCHGFIDPRAHEVALMLAHAGGLPLRDSAVAATSQGRAHRLSWRDLQRLPRAAPVVFSAACSTGLSHVAGLGERLGLFGALRHAGTRAVVAPRWDCWAERVLPVLDDTLERFLGGGVPLGQALHAACRDAAAAGLPRWLAWNLALEGDGR